MTKAQLDRLTSEQAAAIAAARESYRLALVAADPVTFFREYLGVEPWSRQAEILWAVAEHPRVAVRSGHKIGKTTSCAGLALWWYLTRPRALVIITSASDGQIGKQVWPELRRLYGEAARRGHPLEGELFESHQTGLKHPDGRRIFGLATNKTERMGGFSGDELLFIVDEASGIEDSIFEAIEGNRAGGARIAMFGNPTQTSGTFYSAFHTKSAFWKKIHVSSEETPNVVAGKVLVRGLATRDWVEEKRAEWGEEHPYYQFRVRGNFPTQGENSVIGLAIVEAAQRRYATTEASGPLTIGVDVARFGDDDTVIWPVRGKRALEPTVLSGLDTVQVAGHVLQVAKALARPGEIPTVRVDVVGVGAGVVDHLRAHSQIHTVAVNAGGKAADRTYARCRDEIWFALKEWLQDGGAIPADGLLHGELVAPTYSFLPTGKIKVESKDEVKKRLEGQRSTDRADALGLAIYGPTAGSTATYDAPSSDAYWNRAGSAPTQTNLQGYTWRN